MNSKKLIQVARFQFEPDRSEETLGEIYRDNGDEESESDTMGQDHKISSDPWAWCKCCKMPTKKECLYRKEMKSVRYFDLHGNLGSAAKNIALEKSCAVYAFLPSNFFLSLLIKSQIFSQTFTKFRKPF